MNVIVANDNHQVPYALKDGAILRLQPPESFLDGR